MYILRDLDKICERVKGTYSYESRRTIQWHKIRLNQWVPVINFNSNPINFDTSAGSFSALTVLKAPFE